MAKNHSKLKKTRSTSERRVNTKQKLENGKVKENETKKINKNSKIENIREQGLIRITRNMAKVTSVVKFEEPLQNVTEKLSNLNKSKSKNVNKDQKIDQHLATPSSNVVTHAVERTLVKCDTKRITRTMAKGINTAKAENLIEKTDRNRTQSNCNANSLDEKRKSDKTANVKQKEKKQLVKHEIFLQNEICFAKMTGYRPWPAKVCDMSHVNLSIHTNENCYLLFERFCKYLMIPPALKCFFMETTAERALCLNLN